MSVVVDSRILANCVRVTEGPLSRVFLKNDARFIWFILVPRVSHIEELYQLGATERNLLMDEIAGLSQMITAEWHPDKLNVGALGNIVSQLHIHVVARFRNDCAWPHGVWQPSVAEVLYDEARLQTLLIASRQQLRAYGFCEERYFESGC